jgi:acyl carrier protein
MSEQFIYDELTDLFRDLFADDAILLTPTTTAKEIDGWDSLTNLSLMAAVEMRFGIKFLSSEIEDLRNVGGLVELIKSKNTSGDVRPASYPET